MNKISLNILPGLKKWFVEKTNILTAWNTTASDSKIPSEKLVKTELDKKAVKTDMDTALAAKIDKTSIKTAVNSDLTNDDVVGGKAVYDEIKKVEAGIPTGMKHSDITDWNTATSGFEKTTNKATSLASPNDTKYPTTKAVSDGLAAAKTDADTTYATKTELTNGLNTKLNTSVKTTELSSTSSDTQIPSAKAVYDLYSTIPKWNVQVFASTSELPAVGVLGTIYLVKGTGNDKNTYDEYFWNTTSEIPGYEKFGGIDIDVSNFVTINQVVEYLEKIDELLRLKSNVGHTHTNASTTTPGFLSAEDKTKLNNLEQITVDSTINATSTNPVQNKVINTALTGKANTNHTHSITNITNLQSQLNGKANTSHTHNNTYYTKDEINTRLGDIETILNEILGV